MNENLLAAIIKALNRNAEAVEKMSAAQEESNRLMREDIALIREIDLDEIVESASKGH